MRLNCLGLVLTTVLAVCQAGKDIPWTGWTDADQNYNSQRDLKTAETSDYSELIAPQNITARQAPPTDADLDEIIQTILESGRQGRNVDGYDDVYSDPTIQNALNNGDDAQARNLIKDKLCSLGLMQCDDVEGKRPYYNPGDLIYAQPIAIRPVGRPIPSVPIRSGGPPQKYPQQQPNLHRGPYGPPQPMPVPQNNQNFKKVGYSTSPNGPFGPSKPYYDGPPSSSYPGPPGSYPGPYAPGGGPYGQPPSGPGPIYLSKPPGPIYEGPDSPYEFENPGKITLDHGPSHDVHHGHGGSHGPEKPTIVVNANGGAAHTNGGLVGAAATVQQHVHHHFHHGEGGESKGPILPIAVPVPIAHGNGISATEFSSSGYQASQSNGGFNPVNHGGINSGLGGPVNGINGNGVYGGGSSSQFTQSQSQSLFNTGLTKSVFEGLQSQGNQGPATFGHSGSGSNGFGQSGSNSFGQSGSGSNGFAQSGPGSNGFGQSGPGSSGFQSGAVNSFGQSVSGVYNGQTNSFHSNNPEYYKKELNLNGNKGGGQFSQYSQNNYNFAEKYQGQETSRQQVDCVCVPYEQCPAQDVIGRKDDLILPLDPRDLGKDIEALADEGEPIANGTVPVVRVTKEAEAKKDDDDKEEVKKVSKRDVSEKISDDEEQQQADGEARLLGLGAGAGAGGHGGKRIVPTFGVSFGLPYPSGGYPLNPYGSYPAQNPYFGAISPNGLNLGLLNVNPLVSFQVSKNEYGEKLLKPLVNLHVTPNEHLIHKVGGLFHGKKQALVNQHYHQHTHHTEPVYSHHPHHYPHHSGPEVYPTGPHYSHPPTGPYLNHPPTGTGGYGFYREGGVPYNTPTELDYNPNEYYSRSSNLSQPQNYNYQSVYPQNVQQSSLQQPIQNNYANNYQQYSNAVQPSQHQNGEGARNVAFPTSRRRRRDTESQEVEINERSVQAEKRQGFYNPNGGRPPFNNNFQGNQIQQCGARQVCCRRPIRPPQPQNGRQCGTRNSQGINGRIKNPVYVDGDSEFGEYPWQAAILKKDPKESVYVCGGTLIDQQHIITAVHCIKSYGGHDLRVRLGEWDVNHDVEFYPYIERDVISVTVHPEYYAGTLDNDIAILRLSQPVDFSSTPHISPACLPDKFSDFTGHRCWTTGWGKDAFGDYGKYQNILKEVDVPIIGDQQCQQQLRQTRLGYNYKLNPGFICAGGEEGKDACKGDGGGPLVCERNGAWSLVGVVSWGIGCGQVNVPGVYVRVSYYLDWINQVTSRF